MFLREDGRWDPRPTNKQRARACSENPTTGIALEASALPTSTILKGSPDH